MVGLAGNTSGRIREEERTRVDRGAQARMLISAQARVEGGCEWTLW